MSDLQRFRYVRDEQQVCLCEIDETRFGAYVLYDDHLVEIQSLQAQCDAYREALKPFVRLLDAHQNTMSARNDIVFQIDDAKLLTNDLRAAKAALSGGKDE